MTGAGFDEVGSSRYRTLVRSVAGVAMTLVVLAVTVAAVAGPQEPAVREPSDGSDRAATDRLSRLDRMSPEDGPTAYIELGRQVLSDLDGSGRSDVEAEVRFGIGRALRLEEQYSDAIGELETAAELARRSDNSELEASALAELARANFYLGEYDASIAACRTALALAPVADDPDRSWIYENIIAAVQLQRGSFEAAIETSSRALEGRQAAGDRHAEAILLNNIGVAHMYLGDNEPALEYFHRARVIKSELGETDGVADMLANIGDIKHLQGRDAEAIEIHTEALRLREAEGGEQRIAMSLRSLAAALQATGRNRDALDNIERALRIQRKLDLKPEIAACLAIEARALAGLGRGAEAVSVATEAIDLTRSLGMRAREVVALDALVEAYAANGDVELALETQRQARRAENEMMSSQARRDFAEFQAAYEAREKEREIELLRKDNQLQALELRHQRLWRNSLIIGVALLLIVAATLWSRLLAKQREIRDRKAAEQAFALSMERYRRLFERSLAGVFQSDLDGRIVRTNRAFASMLGYHDAGDLEGRSIIDMAETPDVIRRFLDELSEHQEVHNRELVVTTRDGRLASILMNAGRVENSDGGGELIEGVAVDITDRKRAEDDRRRLELDLQQNQKLESLGVLAGGIAHDFNNMLMAILSNISLAKRTAADSRETMHRLNEAEEVCLRATNLTQQLLTFSKGGRPIRKTTRIEGLVEEAAAFAARGCNCALDCRSGQDLWPAEVDEGQIVQVVQNLVLNAIQAMPGGGTVTVTIDNAHLTDGDVPTLDAGRFIQIDVVDTGTGIPESRLDQIFDPFFTTKKGGSGLGLATAFSIVRSHGGAIVVRSQQDRGSRFTVYLPASEQPRNEAEARADEPQQSHGRLLIMDDDEAVRSAAAELLETIGYEVATAADGAKALAMYGEAMDAGRRFDAVVLDLTVPKGVGGRETIARLLEIDPQVKAIVSSGYSTDPVMANYREHGFSGVAVKPYRLADLARTLRAVLDSHRTG